VLDQDISTADALRLLSFRDDDPATLDRRRFLQLVAGGVGGGLALGTLGEALLPGFGPEALDRVHAASSPLGPGDSILVIIGMYGGNDGLNTVVPYTDGNYYTQHGAQAVPAGSVLPLSSTLGLHPNLPELKRWWDDRRLAVVLGVGYPDPDLSHFNSMAYWMSGHRYQIPSSGWVGRWLDGLGGGDDLFRAAAIGTSVPLHMAGTIRRASAVPPQEPPFGGGTDPADVRLYNTVRTLSAPAGRGPWHDAVSAALRDQVDLAATVTPLFLTSMPDDELEQKMEAAARLINANLGFRVYECSWGDFDSHRNQPGMHPTRMAELNAAVARFFTTLNAEWRDQVTVMTFSEFGRTSWDNDSAGTDHGTSSCAFVFGQQVQGGFYGQQPSLAGLDRWDRMPYHVDFRSLYASVIDGWLGGGSSSILNGTFEDLRLFRAPPGAGIPLPPLETGAFVPITPARIYDTRTGDGGAPIRPLGPGGRANVTVLGRGGVPSSNVTAVALNITLANATAGTYLTSFPAGEGMPDTSTVNTVPGRDAPNMTVLAVGNDGTVDVVNAFGQANVIVDVTGYYTKGGGGSLLTPLSPGRVLDTRNEIGAPRAPIGRGRAIDVQVTDVAGVPASGVTGVVLNVTATQSSTGGWLTVYPSGEGQPPTSSLNFAPGQTVPNLVMCKVGANGKVTIYAETSDVHVIADVFGYFSATGQRHTPVRPARILDTRNAIAALGAVGPGNPLALQVAGAGGVPADATAVVMNVTATETTANTYVTIHPAGEGRPHTSNLNVEAGGTIANLVVVKLGTNGQVVLHNEFGATHLIADVLGYYRS
jgi:uncharacterized protein (DUF1501 family)